MYNFILLQSVHSKFVRVTPINFACYVYLFCRARKDYWQHIKPASGRALCAAHATPDNWGVTQGDDILKQKKQQTSDDELKSLFNKCN